MARLLPLVDEETEGRVCRCGCVHSSHWHLRGGSECAICGPGVCPQYKAISYRGTHRNPGPLHRAIDAALGVAATVGVALAMPTTDPGPGDACQEGRRPVSAEDGTR